MTRSAIASVLPVSGTPGTTLGKMQPDGAEREHSDQQQDLQDYEVADLPRPAQGRQS